MDEKPANTGIIQEIPKKLRDKEGKFIKGVSGNPNGKPKGAKSFDTLFEEAIKKIVKEKKISNLTDPETQMVVRAVVEALQGNYAYFRDIMDRKYGKAVEIIDMRACIKSESLIKIQEHTAKILNG